MTKLFFVRHAQPIDAWEEDRTRPLTEEGMRDTEKVLEFFKPMAVDCFYSSPYERSRKTIESTAQYFGKAIRTDERLRERQKGAGGNVHGLFQKRWADKTYHEPDGESIQMVQERNMEALFELLEREINKVVVIGTHGTALSSILNYFDSTFDCASFLRLIDWMPYIIELDFVGRECVGKTEHFWIKKEFNGQNRADKC